MNINEAYRKLCQDLLNKGHSVGRAANPKGATVELNNYCFTVDELDKYPYISLKSRDLSMTYLLGELTLYLDSRNDLKSYTTFSKFWENVSDDGLTVNSAYGYILQQKHGFNQIEKVVELLKTDQNTRRAVLNINVPNEHMIETKDEPCTICLDFIIRDGKLNCTCVMRSNDVNFGLSYDYSYFVLIQRYIAQRVGVELGTYTHFAMSIHFYEKDRELIEKIANSGLEERKIKFFPDSLLKRYKDLLTVIDHFTDDQTRKYKRDIFESQCVCEGIVNMCEVIEKSGN